ncbi:MAG TPA: hypothetical protein DF774_11365 [Rheinheimera sp.]|nr:hypothetical protein [Rheinheimera sp.]
MSAQVSQHANSSNFTVQFAKQASTLTIKIQKSFLREFWLGAILGRLASALFHVSSKGCASLIPIKYYTTIAYSILEYAIKYYPLNKK